MFILNRLNSINPTFHPIALQVSDLVHGNTIGIVFRKLPP